MQYSPTLKKAMEEIKETLKKYDVAALVVLHKPGFSEYIMKVNTTYSCAFFEGDNLRVRAKKQDYPSIEAWKEKVAATSNMLNHIGTMGGQLSLNFLELSKRVDEIVGAQHTGGNHSSHTDQNQ